MKMDFQMSLTHIQIDTTPWLEKLETLFGKMGREYDRVSGLYGFNCRGCEDNCCFSRFYHHTLLEHLYLKKGLETLDSQTLARVKERAETVARVDNQADMKGERSKIMCPLNAEGMCMVYQYRPMVCRLHGIAHELKKPGQSPVRGSGCELFTETTRNMDYIPFDRTPFYMEMARLEGELRQAAGFTERLKNTIARMVLL